MAAWPLAFILLLSHLLSALGAKRLHMEVIVPEMFPLNGHQVKEKMVFHIPTSGKIYTVLLNQQSFLTNEFRVYMYNEAGSVVAYSPSIQRNCFYQGYVSDTTDSMVMLNICLGLRGLLQIGNITYGIEPVVTASNFRHLIYQIDYSDAEFNVSKSNYSIEPSPELFEKDNPDKPMNFATVRYVEVHVIVAKTLFHQMGSTEEMVMEKIMQLFCFVNAMFYKLNLRIILSSLEFWAKKDEMLTTSPPRQLLEEFVRWKQIHLILRPHNLAFLFVYSSAAESLGATFAKKICSKHSSAGIAVYQNGMTLEAFSVVVTQLLGFTLGLYFEDDRECVCPGPICLMDIKAVHSSGVKPFSSCSLSDFQKHLRHGSSQCLLNRPRGRISSKVPHCGNRVVEEGEQCDCGTPKQCERNPCCELGCMLKRGKECAQGGCCWPRTCKLKAKGILCRESLDKECDLEEYCNGTSPVCTEDFHVQDGQYCEGESGVCLKGVCQSPDIWCRKLFGKDSKSGSLQCYEEINSQKDRMGNCGTTTEGYISCQWEDLQCGKLVCEYPDKKPFIDEDLAIMYVKVNNRLCVALDYLTRLNEKDAFLVRDGTRCGEDKICMRQKCVDRSILKINCDSKINCNNRGRCNNRGHCHCNPGWAPPDCGKIEEGGIGGSIDSTFRRGAVMHRRRHKVSPKTRNWLLVGFFLFLPLIIGSVFFLKNMSYFCARVKVEKQKEDEEEDCSTKGTKSEAEDQSETASV